MSPKNLCCSLCTGSLLAEHTSLHIQDLVKLLPGTLVAHSTPNCTRADPAQPHLQREAHLSLPLLVVRRKEDSKGNGRGSSPATLRLSPGDNMPNLQAMLPSQYLLQAEAQACRHACWQPCTSSFCALCNTCLLVLPKPRRDTVLRQYVACCR